MDGSAFGRESRLLSHECMPTQLPMTPVPRMTDSNCLMMHLVLDMLQEQVHLTLAEGVSSKAALSMGFLLAHLCPVQPDFDDTGCSPPAAGPRYGGNLAVRGAGLLLTGCGYALKNSSAERLGCTLTMWWVWSLFLSGKTVTHYALVCCYCC